MRPRTVMCPFSRSSSSPKAFSTALSPEATSVQRLKKLCKRGNLKTASSLRELQTRQGMDMWVLRRVRLWHKDAAAQPPRCRTYRTSHKPVLLIRVSKPRSTPSPHSWIPSRNNLRTLSVASKPPPLRYRPKLQHKHQHPNPPLPPPAPSMVNQSHTAPPSPHTNPLPLHTAVNAHNRHACVRTARSPARTPTPPAPPLRQ